MNDDHSPFGHYVTDNKVTCQTCQALQSKAKFKNVLCDACAYKYKLGQIKNCKNCLEPFTGMGRYCSSICEPDDDKHYYLRG